MSAWQKHGFGPYFALTEANDITMQKGQIRVQTENIFPIIKKFLYSDHEIFVRELVSNAVDASQKLKTLSSKGEVKGDIGDLRVDVIVDAKEKTISIIDNGIGMSAEEVDKYINQVAFSGAEEFVTKYQDASIIGHFGLGFYSSFMVSDKVDIYTKSHTDAPGVFWSCDGSPSYELYEVDYSNRGTKIVMHINEESKEFLEPSRVKSILDRFCKFLPVAIFFKDANEEVKEAKTEEGKEVEAEVEKPINNTNPIWVRKPADLTKEDYENFYKELYPFGEKPLFWIHLNVDYPFNLTGILYFPKIKQSFEIQKDKIQLYCNQVFVTDEVKDIVPEFLMLLHGVIDSPDIPLNVSRSYLQGDPNVKKINAHITKKVADKLEEIFNNDRKAFEEKWESLGLFVKYGMITDDKFLEKGNKFLILEDAAEALGSEYDGKKAGSIADVGVFSFHGTKTMTTGEGGVLVTNNEAVYEKAKILNDHGRNAKDQENKMFWMRDYGYKYKMSNLQAALGCAQISRIEELVNKKREIFNWYKELLKDIPCQMNPELENTKNSYWLPTVVFDKSLNFDRNAFFELCKENGIDSRPFFFPLSSLPMFEDRKENVISYDIFERSINLPSYHDLEKEEVELVGKIIINFINIRKC